MRASGWAAAVSMVLMLGMLGACGGRGVGGPAAASGGEPTPTGSPTTESGAASDSEGGAGGSMGGLIRAISVWTFGLGQELNPAEVHGWYEHHATKSCLPAGHGDYAYLGHLVYDANNEAVRLRRDDPLTLATMYVYPTAVSTKEEFEGAAAAMGQNCTGPMLTTDVSDSRFPDGGHVAVCTALLEDGTELVEQVVVLGKGGFAYKLRTTWPTQLTERAGAEAQGLLQLAFNPCPKNAKPPPPPVVPDEPGTTAALNLPPPASRDAEPTSRDAEPTSRDAEPTSRDAEHRLSHEASARFSAPQG